MCKTWTGSFPERKDLEEGFHFQPTKDAIYIQVLPGFSLNSWIAASFRCQDKKMGQRHSEMTCGYFKYFEVKTANIRALVFHQVTPDVPGSHWITHFPLKLKEQAGFWTRQLSFCFVSDLLELEWFREGAGTAMACLFSFQRTARHVFVVVFVF